MGDQIQGQGEVPEMTVTQNPHYLKIEYEGKTIVEIDVLNTTQNIGFIDGVVDHLETIRNALGL